MEVDTGVSVSVVGALSGKTIRFPHNTHPPLCSAPPSFGSMAADLGQTPYELATLLAPISEDWILVSPCTNLSARERG